MATQYANAPPVLAATGTSEPEEVIPTKGFQTKSGLKYFDIKVTDKKYPLYGQLISFKYTMYYRAKDGRKLEKIDSSTTDKGDGVFLQKHGNGRIIRGIDEALHTMGIGAKRRVIVPKSLGYNNFGLGPLPLEASKRRRLGDLLDELDKDLGDLLFDLELVAIKEDENDQGYYDDVPVTQDDVRKLVIKSLRADNPEFLNSVKDSTPPALYRK